MSLVRVCGVLVDAWAAEAGTGWVSRGGGGCEVDVVLSLSISSIKSM